MKSKAAIPGFREDQSTLTQLDFFPLTSSRSDIIDMSSDEDFEDPRPKKKRRKSKFNGKEAGQSTLTQLDRTFSARKAQPESELDDDGFQIWEDSDIETPSGGLAQRLNGGRSKSTFLQDPIEEVQSVEPEIPETSQLDIQSNWEDKAEATKAAAALPMKLRTPSKVQFMEVPSSQTPPSTVESAKNVKRTCQVERSPLKQKSANMQVAPSLVQQSPQSQNISMKMLERVRLQSKKIPLNDVTKKHESSEIIVATHEDVDATPKAQTESRPPLFTRISTIQDSQSEGASLSTVSSNETMNSPMRRLQRVSTIQDSQFDDDDLMSIPKRLTEDEYLIFAEESQFSLEDTQHGYFDPVNSALDRDALRFRWTQTQKQLSDINEEESDAETDDGDLDRGRPEELTPRIGIPGSNPPAQNAAEPLTTRAAQSKDSDQLPPAIKPAAVLLDAQKPGSRDDSACESGDHANRDEVLVLSSSPPLRPSQVSTFVPTHASLHKTATQDENIVSAQAINDPVEPATVPISPYKPIHHFEVLSSSPFPLPPWNSPEKVRAQNQMNQSSSPLRSSQLPQLVDYSLPPPPALSSSGGGTPVSSSR